MRVNAAVYAHASTQRRTASASWLPAPVGVHVLLAPAAAHAVRCRGPAARGGRRAVRDRVCRPLRVYVQNPARHRYAQARGRYAHAAVYHASTRTSSETSAQRTPATTPCRHRLIQGSEAGWGRRVGKWCRWGRCAVGVGCGGGGGGAATSATGNPIQRYGRWGWLGSSGE